MARRQTMGERVREILRARGWKQATLAEIARIPTSYLSRLLSGKRRWTLPYVEAVARAFELPEASLVTDTEVASLVCSRAATETAAEMSSLHKLSEVEAHLQKARADMAALRARNAELYQDLERASDEIERLREEPRAEREELCALRTRVALLEQELEKHNANSDELRGTQQRLRGLVEVLSARVKSQYQTLSARDAELEHLRRELRALEATLETTRRHGEEVEQEVVQQKARIAWVRGSENTAQALAMLHGYAARVLTTRLEAREGELSLRGRRILELTAEVERLKAELAIAAPRTGIERDQPNCTDRRVNEPAENPVMGNLTGSAASMEAPSAAATGTKCS